MLIVFPPKRSSRLDRSNTSRQRDEHWAVFDLIGKYGRIRIVPMPASVQAAIEEWNNLRRAITEEARYFAPSPKAA